MLQNTGVNTQHVRGADDSLRRRRAQQFEQIISKKEKPETCFKTDTQQHDAYKKKHTHSTFLAKRFVEMLNTVLELRRF
jgi:ribosomal protein L14E/L6E/L27E